MVQPALGEEPNKIQRLKWACRVIDVTLILDFDRGYHLESDWTRYDLHTWSISLQNTLKVVSTNMADRCDAMRWNDEC